MVTNEIIRLTNSRNLALLNDYKELIEEKQKFLKRNRPQDSNIIEEDEDEKNENEEKGEDNID